MPDRQRGSPTDRREWTDDPVVDTRVRTSTRRRAAQSVDTGATVEAGEDDAVLHVGADGRVAHANRAAARLLGADAAVALLGLDVAQQLRAAGLGGASLALHSAAAALHARDVDETAFTVHDASGLPTTQWRVTSRGSGIVATIRAAAPATEPAPTGRAAATPNAHDDHAETLLALTHAVAVAADALEPALDRLAAGAQSLLSGAGACVVELRGDGDTGDRGDAHVVAAVGSLADQRGERTTVGESSSPLREAITTRRVVVRTVDGRCVLVAPLLAGGEAAAVLCVVTDARAGFTDDERAVAARLAELGAAILRRHRHVDAVWRAARDEERDRAAATAEIARVALDAPSLDVGAAALLAVLDRLVPSPGKALSVRTPFGDPAHAPGDTPSVACVAATGAIAFLSDASAAGAAPLASDGHVAPVVIDDLRTVLTSMRCPDAAAHPALAASAALVPLVARGHAAGELVVTTPLGTPLETRHRDTLAALAPSLALALDALLLAEERRRRLAEERQIADQLRQAEKMAALGELVAGVAHEINNPLTGISAFAELLLDDPLSDDQRESVRLIKREADRAVGVVRDLLAFSRAAEPSYVSLDVNELVERTLRLRAYALRVAGVDVRLALAPRLPAVAGDDAKLQQVILNVILNAEHALRDAAEKRLEVSTRPDGGGRRVVVAISDSGAGIAPDVLPRIFDPFFTTKPSGEGTGLGLSVSYGIIQSHGGELRARSTQRQGATFEIALPARGGGRRAGDVRSDPRSPALVALPS